MKDEQKNSKWKTTKKIKIKKNKVNQYNLIKIPQFGCGTAPGNLFAFKIIAFSRDISQFISGLHWLFYVIMGP